MRLKTLSFLTLLLLMCPSTLLAQRRSGSSRSSGRSYSSATRSHSAASRRSSSSSVHVPSYTRKNGTRVRSYDRSSSGAGNSASRARTNSRASYTSRRSSGGTRRGEIASLAVRGSNGRIQRSQEAKDEFMRQTGFSHGRPGYVVDHIVALACGGADSPSNMQWQTAAEAKAKDKTERRCK
jgi:hypothetical protein